MSLALKLLNQRKTARVLSGLSKNVGNTANPLTETVFLQLSNSWDGAAKNISARDLCRRVETNPHANVRLREATEAERQWPRCEKLADNRREQL